MNAWAIMVKPKWEIGLAVLTRESALRILPNKGRLDRGVADASRTNRRLGRGLLTSEPMLCDCVRPGLSSTGNEGRTRCRGHVFCQ